jgi:hypothetical protein
VGIISSGVRNESDPALALLTDYLESPTASANVRTASAMGLGACAVMFADEGLARDGPLLFIRVDVAVFCVVCCASR